MKKIYSFFLFAFAFVASLSAQTTIYDSAFDEASYDDAGVQADLNAHPDWIAGHFNNSNTWTANTADQLLTGSNFAYAVLGTPITGVEGDVITVTSVIMLGFNNQNFDGNTTNMTITGLSPEAAPATGPVLGQQREGVVIATIASTSVEISNGGGTGALMPSNPNVSQANKSAYEIIMEFTIGADAASSSKKVRIKNVGTAPETSIVGTVGGMRQEIYDAITGTGAYYFNWALGFFQSGDEINRIVQNRLTITKNSPLLSTNRHNAFEFGLYPNPVKNELRVDTLEPINKIEIFDLLGKSVLTFNDVSDRIDVSSLNKSLYIIKLTSENGVSSKKFLKE
ncbi:T9SS type A sorting domain-containing protein [uncultured Algibacter sp.]|uniref:T9SS type A sorting domain-containing protein n=1 Tax=uncultured Algibacter sp. TaxID=298659 RepID=UPI00262A8064|nr:T9SS type A sorting domain-containing protein [uncultured Algibacter sp.]